jgi:hypothetical protein
MVIVLMRVYSSHMNEHAASRETGGFLFEFRGKRPLRETAQWVAGFGLSVAGVAIAVIGTAANSYLSMPLGIAITVLGVLVLVTYALTKRRSRSWSAGATTARAPRTGVFRGRAQQSLATELALLANLHSQGALSSDEFEAAKRRLLGT